MMMTDDNTDELKLLEAMKVTDNIWRVTAPMYGIPGDTSGVLYFIESGVRGRQPGWDFDALGIETKKMSHTPLLAITEWWKQLLHKSNDTWACHGHQFYCQLIERYRENQKQKQKWK